MFVHVVCVWPVQSREKAAGAEQHRAHRQHGSPLIDPVQVASRHVSHTNGPRRAEHKFISIPVTERETKTHIYQFQQLCIQV